MNTQDLILYIGVPLVVILTIFRYRKEKNKAVKRRENFRKKINEIKRDNNVR